MQFSTNNFMNSARNLANKISQSFKPKEMQSGNKQGASSQGNVGQAAVFNPMHENQVVHRLNIQGIESDTQKSTAASKPAPVLIEAVTAESVEKKSEPTRTPQQQKMRDILLNLYTNRAASDCLNRDAMKDPSFLGHPIWKETPTYRQADNAEKAIAELDVSAVDGFSPSLDKILTLLENMKAITSNVYKTFPDVKMSKYGVVTIPKADFEFESLAYNFIHTLKSLGATRANQMMGELERAIPKGTEKIDDQTVQRLHETILPFKN